VVVKQKVIFYVRVEPVGFVARPDALQPPGMATHLLWVTYLRIAALLLIFLGSLLWISGAVVSAFAFAALALLAAEFGLLDEVQPATRAAPTATATVAVPSARTKRPKFLSRWPFEIGRRFAHLNRTRTGWSTADNLLPESYRL